MRWKYRLLVGFLALWIGVIVYDVLFAPGSLFRINLRGALHAGASLPANVGTLSGKGFTCNDLDPPGTSAARANVLCYRYNDPASAPHGDGTQVAFAAENGTTIGFVIRACGPLQKYLCDKPGARPGRR